MYHIYTLCTCRSAESTLQGNLLEQRSKFNVVYVHVYVYMCACVYVHVCVCMSTEMCSPPGDQGTQVGPPTPMSHSKLMRKTESSFEVSVGGTWPLPYPVCACVYYCTPV